MNKEEKLELIKAQINKIDDKVAALKVDKEELMIKAAGLCKFKKGDKVVPIRGNRYTINNKALIVYDILFSMHSNKIKITTKQIKKNGEMSQHYYNSWGMYEDDFELYTER